MRAAGARVNPPHRFELELGEGNRGVAGTETEHMPLYLRTLFRVLSSLGARSVMSRDIVYTCLGTSLHVQDPATAW